jgi:hypothetical protein
MTARQILLSLLTAALPALAWAQGAGSASDPTPLAPVPIALGFLLVAALLVVIVGGPLRAHAHAGARRRPRRGERR